MRRIRTLIAIASVLCISSICVRAEPSLHPSTLTLINKFMATVVPPLSQSRLVAAEIETVGCPQDGQVGPQEAPKLPKTVRVIIPEGTAPALTFYSASENANAGVLAPRGWDCFGIYGSSGSSLYVVPRRLGDPILDRPEKVKDGPFVITTSCIGGTSGRFPVARISARIFPRARAFAESVRDENFDDPKNYVFAPWPADRIDRLSDLDVSYVTPPMAEGLGIDLGFAPGHGFTPGREPISGLAFLSDLEKKEDGPFLEMLGVRLDRGDQRLYAAIAVNMIASADAALAKNAETTTAPINGAIGVVSAFYEALGRADGVAASALVIPEKRDRGPFSASEITRYYSGLSEPLWLLAVTRLDDRSVRARYRYRSASGTVCDGEAIVTLRQAGETSLIERVRALKKC